MIAGKILSALADVVFPPRCAVCGEVLKDDGADPFCRRCHAALPRIGEPLCPRCGLPHPPEARESHLCGDCLREDPPFGIARAAGRHEGIWMETIHRFKYGGKFALGRPLGRFLAACPFTGMDIRAFDLVMAVPLHVRRLRARGYNQSLLLAREIARARGLPLDRRTLVRRRPTPPQVELGRTARADNVRGAFAVENAGQIADKHILLVDDVFTTGSTIRECCRVLRESGAASVGVLTLSRAVSGDAPPPKGFPAAEP